MHQIALHALHVSLMKGQNKKYLWIDSTTLPVCKNQRIKRHKSLAKIATIDSFNFFTPLSAPRKLIIGIKTAYF